MSKADHNPTSASSSTSYNPIVRLIRTLPKPVIAAVNGLAAGAGASLALACDLVYAARSASFMQAFAKIGLIPDCGSTWMLPRLVGDARARGLAMLAEPLTRREGRGLGADLESRRRRQARQPRSMPWPLALLPVRPTALRCRSTRSPARHTTRSTAQLDLERALQSKAGASPDYAEGVERVSRQA